MKWISIKEKGCPKEGLVGKKVMCWMQHKEEPVCAIYDGNGSFIETRKSDIYNDNEDVITHWCEIIKPTN